MHHKGQYQGARFLCLCVSCSGGGARTSAWLLRQLVLAAHGLAQLGPEEAEREAAAAGKVPQRACQKAAFAMHLLVQHAMRDAAAAIAEQADGQVVAAVE